MRGVDTYRATGNLEPSATNRWARRVVHATSDVLRNIGRLVFRGGSGAPANDAASTATFRHAGPSTPERLMHSEAWELADKARRGDREAMERLARADMEADTKAHAADWLADRAARMPEDVRMAALNFVLGTGREACVKVFDKLCIELVEPALGGDRLHFSSTVTDGEGGPRSLEDVMSEACGSDAAVVFPALIHVAYHYGSLSREPPNDDQDAFVNLLLRSRKTLSSTAFTRLVEALSLASPKMAGKVVARHGDSLVPSKTLDDLRPGVTVDLEVRHERYLTLQRTRFDLDAPAN